MITKKERMQMKRAMINKKLLSLVTVTAVGLTMTCAPVFASGKNVKEETVYVVTDSSGTATETIVSDHLVNNTDSKTLTDESNLTDIENVKGDEKFTKEGNTVKWKANGNDIYYQGNTSKSAPVSMDVTYYLNGKKTTGEKLQGKSGDVKIKIKYSNDASVNGTKVPFVVMTGFLADNSTFKNIKIDNGKVIDNGDKSIVVGMAVPGLKDTLGIDSDKISLGDEVTITGTAKKFDCENMMTVVTNSLYQDLDTDEVTSLNYDDKVNQLDSSGKQLVEGTQTLYNGISLMNNKKGALVSGVNKLDEGASSLASGTSDLQSGVNQLSNKLTDSLNEICDNLDKITSGATSLESGLNQVKAGITKKDESDPTNTGLLDAISKASDYSGKAKAAAGAAESQAESAKDSARSAKDKTGTVKENIDSASEALKNIDTEGMTDEQKTAIEKAIDTVNKAKENSTNIDSAMKTAEGAAEAAETYAKNAQAAASGAEQYANGSKSGANSISNAIGSKDTEKTLLYAAHSINAGSSTMKNTISESNTTGDLAKGLKNLKSGTTQLNSGAKQLASGMSTLSASTDTLASGIGKLASGSSTLKDGMSQYYTQGIKQIVDLYNNDIKGVLNDLDDVVKAGKEYDSFTKVSNDMDSSVNFVYKTEISD